MSSLFLPVSGRSLPHFAVGLDPVAMDQAIKRAEAAGLMYWAGALRQVLAQSLGTYRAGAAGADACVSPAALPVVAAPTGRAA